MITKRDFILRVSYFCEKYRESVCVVYIFLVIRYVIPSLFSSTHPYTLFTCLILFFIFLITSSRYHITPHPSIIQIPRLSPISSITSYYSTQYISTHPPSYKYHDHLTFTNQHSSQKAPILHYTQTTQKSGDKLPAMKIILNYSPI